MAPATVHQCLAARATGFVPKPASLQTLTLALRKVLCGEVYPADAGFADAGDESDIIRSMAIMLTGCGATGLSAASFAEAHRVLAAALV